MKLIARVGSVLLAIGASVAAMPAAGEMPMAELGAGMYRIEAEVASTFEDRQRGLMFRRTMPQQHGMLFVFTEEARHCMWMKNTDLPLSVAFIDGAGRVVNIEDMQPHTEDNHCAASPARYALEMNIGWFRERGIKPGDSIRGIDRLPPAH